LQGKEKNVNEERVGEPAPEARGGLGGGAVGGGGGGWGEGRLELKGQKGRGERKGPEIVGQKVKEGKRGGGMGPSLFWTGRGKRGEGKKRT